MAFEECNFDIGEFEHLIFDNIESGSSDNNLSEFDSQLCVPQDPIEELEKFPYFPNDFISLNEVEWVMPEIQQNKDKEELKAKQQNKEVVEFLVHGFIGKKARTKNYHKPKCVVKWVKKRCSHCEAEETPQWRNGPLGPKTLCNACGVRYKSGRLVSDYRPANSPTFDSSKHSNYHRNIIKRRRC
ncbi:hypothetical protein Lal_00004545 [Lupinus albus]|uniref:Putative transcription factor C2C2-GATA family n=1 Tax=Lupinus albus TaxID=3870 RepID=A0A6A5LSY6_LUPAL|nr:putative transcription factor C2C2-GATA family [Lupinus albus]KAF1865171.1 hypothetical protein Lal_00004545 [Lupinus albus]